MNLAEFVSSLSDVWFIQSAAARWLYSRYEKLLDSDPGTVELLLQSARESEVSDFVQRMVETEDGVARVRVSGVLANKPLPSRGSTGPATYGEIRQALELADSDPRVKSIALMFDTPGGNSDGVAETARAIRAVSKPTLGVCENRCGSAGYWLASQTDRLVANQTAEVGSIGGFTVLDDVSKMLEDRGISRTVVSTGEYKGLGTLGTPVDEKLVEDVQRRIEDLVDIFVGDVAEGRGLARDDAIGLADGRMHIASKAVKLNLIDDVIALDEVQQEALGLAGAGTGAAQLADADDERTTKEERESFDLAKLKEVNSMSDSTSTEAQEALEAAQLANQEASEAREEANRILLEARETKASMEVDREIASLSDVPPAVFKDGVRELLVELRMNPIELSVGDKKVDGYDVLVGAVGQVRSGLIDSGVMADGEDTGNAPDASDGRSEEVRQLHENKGLSEERVADLREKYGLTESLN